MQWIPVSERLPPQHEEIFIRMRGFMNIGYIHCAGVYSPDNSGYRKSPWLRDTGSVIINPTHWAIITPPTEGE